MDIMRSPETLKVITGSSRKEKPAEEAAPEPEQAPQPELATVQTNEVEEKKESEIIISIE